MPNGCYGSASAKSRRHNFFYAGKSVSDNTHVPSTGFGDSEYLVGGADQIVGLLLGCRIAGANAKANRDGALSAFVVLDSSLLNRTAVDADAELTHLPM
jgi:hypothetical protein